MIDAKSYKNFDIDKTGKFITDKRGNNSVDKGFWDLKSRTAGSPHAAEANKFADRQAREFANKVNANYAKQIPKGHPLHGVKLYGSASDLQKLRQTMSKLPPEARAKMAEEFRKVEEQRKNIHKESFERFLKEKKQKLGKAAQESADKFRIKTNVSNSGKSPAPSSSVLGNSATPSPINKPSPTHVSPKLNGKVVTSASKVFGKRAAAVAGGIGVLGVGSYALKRKGDN